MTRLVIEIRGGIVNVLSANQTMEILIKDYDVQAVDAKEDYVFEDPKKDKLYIGNLIRTVPSVRGYFDVNRAFIKFRQLQVQKAWDKENKKE